jgi:hypothetical protein
MRADKPNTMTRLFSSRSTARSTALAMLAVWLLALGVGFANACLLDTGGTWHDPAPGRASFVAAPANGHGMPLPAVDAGQVVPDETACLEFCAAERTAVAKQPADPKAQQTSVHVWTHANLAPLAASSLASTRPADGAAALPHQPGSTLFQRLTL